MPSSTAQTLEFSKEGHIGVSKTIKVEGDGPKPTMGDVLTVTYLGYEQDGRVIVDKRNEEITLGMRMMWGTGGDLGLLSMRIGERAIIVMEHEFAGPNAGPGSPPFSLDVRLLAAINQKDIAARELRYIIYFLLFTAAFGVFFLWKEGHFHK